MHRYVTCSACQKSIDTDTEEVFMGDYVHFYHEACFKNVHGAQSSRPARKFLQQACRNCGRHHGYNSFVPVQTESGPNIFWFCNQECADEFFKKADSS